MCANSDWERRVRNVKYSERLGDGNRAPAVVVFGGDENWENHGKVQSWVGVETGGGQWGFGSRGKAVPEQ